MLLSRRTGKHMKYGFLIALATLSLDALAAPHLNLPGCNLQEQHALTGQLGGQITDARQAHVSVRADILSADISTSRKARNLTQAQADQMIKRIEEVRIQSDHFVAQQGFLSAAENASFDREFDGIASKLCQ
jgi:hypothetical protein